MKKLRKLELLLANKLFFNNLHIKIKRLTEK
jgi:hypothetical protein